MPLWTTDHRAWYRTVYLRSDHWRKLRAAKLREQPLCPCGARAWEVHHLRYRDLFNVRLGDLLSLCGPCHREHHRVHGFPRRPKPKAKRVKRWPKGPRYPAKPNARPAPRFNEWQPKPQKSTPWIKV